MSPSGYTLGPTLATLSLLCMLVSSMNPIPLGSFREGDELPVGTFVLNGCASIDRRVLNFSCSVNGFQDAWGVVVVTYPEGYVQQKTTKGISRQPLDDGYLLYSNESS